MPTTYPYAAGKDPTYDAWKAQADYQRAMAQQDADFARQQALDSYNTALASLSEQGQRGGRSINTSMLGRGVYRSGETNRRQAELQAEVLKGQANANNSYQGALGKVDSDLQRALTSLDLEAEQQAQAAMSRAAGGGGRGGSGGGGGAGYAGGSAPSYTDWLQAYLDSLPGGGPGPMPMQPGAGAGRGAGVWGPAVTTPPKPTPKPGKTTVGKVR